MSRRETANRGFTLIEIVIAFIIASVALVALMRGGGDGIGAAIAAGHYQDALSRARSHLAALGRSVTLEPQTLEGDDGDGYRWYLTVTRAAVTTQRLAAPGAPDQNGEKLALFRIDMTIGWREGGRQRRVTLNTQRLGRAVPDGL